MTRYELPLPDECGTNPCSRCDRLAGIISAAEIANASLRHSLLIERDRREASERILRAVRAQHPQGIAEGPTDWSDAT